MKNKKVICLIAIILVIISIGLILAGFYFMSGNEKSNNEEFEVYILNEPTFPLEIDEAVEEFWGEEEMEKAMYTVAYDGYKFLLYDDGKVAYTDPEAETDTLVQKGIVVNEEGEQLVAYKFIAIESGEAYFVSSDKKLYKVSTDGFINEADELSSQLINDSPVYSFSYKKDSKETVIVTFENGKTYSINDVLYKVSYKLYEN